MIPRVTIFLVLFVVYGVWSIQAQNISNAYFENLSIKNGLPDINVNAVLQDHHGFMWFGTYKGLAWYDGYSFRIVEGDVDSLATLPIYSLSEDHQNNIWVGSLSHGLYLKEAQSDKLINMNLVPSLNDLAHTWILSIIEDAAHNIWIGTRNKGIVRFNPKTRAARWYTMQNSQLKDNSGVNFILDKNNTLWVATMESYIYRFNENIDDFTPYAIPTGGARSSNNYNKAFRIDNNGLLWMSCFGEGVFTFNFETKQFVNTYTLNSKVPLPYNRVSAFMPLEDGKVLLQADEGLFYYDPKLNKFELLNSNLSNATFRYGNTPRCITKDKQKNIWIGTFNAGVYIWQYQEYISKIYAPPIKSNDFLPIKSILRFAQTTTNGRILVGTDGRGLYSFDLNTYSFTKIPNTANNYGFITKTIFEDSKKRIWLGYYSDGMSIYDPVKKSYQHFKFNSFKDSVRLFGNNIWGFAEDKNGEIWLCSTDYGISRYNPATKTFINYKHDKDKPNSLTSNQVLTILVDSQNNVWAGTEGRGICRFDRNTNTFERFQHNPKDPKSIGGDNIRAMYQDSKGRIWVGSVSGGLSLYTPNGFINFSKKDGLLSNQVLAITEDKMGYLWLSNEKGVARFNFEKNTFLNIGFQRKNSINQFTSQAILCTHDNKILIGGIYGMNIIDANRVDTSTEKPTILLTQLKIFNTVIKSNIPYEGRTILPKNLQALDEIELSYLDKMFSISFSRSDFVNSSESVFAYKLEGFNKEWQYLDNNKYDAIFTNIAPGTYELVVKVMDNTNTSKWSDERRLKIVISPPFWATWWFRILGVCAISFLVYYLFKNYITQRELIYKEQLLESETEILRLKNMQLSTEIEDKNSVLVSQSAQVAYKNEFLNSIKDQLKELKEANDEQKNKRLRMLTKDLESELHGEENWAQFTLYFDQVNQNFTKVLLKKHPKLTPHDLKICTLTKLNLSTKEIASLLSITSGAVQKSRYRLKKRLDLDEKDSIYEYLQGIKDSEI